MFVFDGIAAILPSRSPRGILNKSANEKVRLFQGFVVVVVAVVSRISDVKAETTIWSKYEGSSLAVSKLNWLLLSDEVRLAELDDEKSTISLMSVAI